MSNFAGLEAVLDDPNLKSVIKIGSVAAEILLTLSLCGVGV